MKTRIQQSPWKSWRRIQLRKPETALLLAALIAVPTGAGRGQIYDWTTIAGLAATSGSADGTNGGARFYRPGLCVADGGTNLYVADILNSTIRKVTKTGPDWVVTTIAGLASNPGTADGTNSEARFKTPSGLAMDTSGILYTTEYSNCVVRKITPMGTNWVVRTLAGLAGTPGSADGTNSTARFFQPQGIAVDGDGNLFVADTYNYTVRRLTPVGTNWVVTTIAGTAGSRGVTDGTNGSARFRFPVGVAVDPTGDIHVADENANTARKISPIGTNWVVTSFAGLEGSPGTADGTNSSARFQGIGAVAANRNGDIYVIDFFSSTVRRLTRVETNWVVTTIGGLAGSNGSSDGTNSAARFYRPIGLATAGAGALFVADTFNHTIRYGSPLPLLQAVALTNGTITFSWSAVAGLSYQLQYTTNAHTPAWIDSGGPIAAGADWMTASDVVGPDAQRFYRVVQLP